MKSSFFFLLVLSLLFACQKNPAIDTTFSNNLSLEEFDYFANDMPFNAPFIGSQFNSNKKAALGRILFYDTRLSQNNSIACANCHNQEQAFSDNKRFSAGLENYETSRNSMTLVNNAYQISHFWEGHQGPIQNHILSPISNHIEMGMKSVDELIEKLSGIEDYNTLFNEVYGNEINEASLTSALATFVASIISYNSKFDKGKSIDFVNFTANELSGKDLFFGKAKCGDCHKGDHFTASWRKSANIGLDLNYEDQGSGDGKFKVPSLRNIALTSPYMHDGRFNTLEEVVDHYVNGVKAHPSLDWTLTSKIDLTELEQSQLIEFLETLTDYELVADQRFSNPF